MTNTTIQENIKSTPNKPILLFLSIFLVFNVIFFISNIKIRTENKKLTSDNLSLYEMVEVTNITRSMYSNRVEYLEGLISYAGIDLNSLYYIDFVDEAYEKYEETIAEFKQIDINKIFDQYLNKDYNDMLMNKRIGEENE